ncbi:MAG TPA: hypothetical protein VFJ87_01930 [Rhodanobacteraceae bacterium]|jgi:hypothetical protein|nr:hypothetical protein [Rhodanobacteraceae bacterium]
MISVSTSHFRIAILAVLALAVAGLSPAVLADATTTVTFQSNNPWAQEVGTVDHYSPSHDYSVAVAAGKTLHINLLTRNPNLFFKIIDETHDSTLVDTMQTGATTWSANVPTAATFTIHVYAEPSTLERGDTVKYALQVGAFGAADMRPASTEVTFQPNNPWTQEVGRIDSGAAAHDYTVAVAAGNTLQVNLIAKDANLHFKVMGADQAVLVDTAATAPATTTATTTTGGTTWSTPVTAAATYTVRVYADPASLPAGAAFGYALQIGQYPTNRTQPAAGASAAMPAGAASAAAPAGASSAAH